MNKHIAFPSIGQFKNIIKQVSGGAMAHNVPSPVLEFEGTVKLHGTNAGVCQDSEGNIWFQSRERLVSLTSDNAGFALWAESKRDLFARVFANIRSAFPGDYGTISLYGEWCGGNIQKGVGLRHLPKMLVIFGVRLGASSQGKDWLTRTSIEHAFSGETGNNLFHIYQFPTYTITVDVTQPELAQNELIRLTEQVEAQCPVAAQLLGETNEPLIGEGIVWSCRTRHPKIDLRGLFFKTKGEKHSVSKVVSLVPIDEEAVESAKQFVDSFVTEARLQQGIDKLKEQGKDTADPKFLGDYIKWVVADVLKEEHDNIAANQLDVGKIKKRIFPIAREFYFNAAH